VSGPGTTKPGGPAGAAPTVPLLWGALLASQLVYLAILVSGALPARERPLDLAALPVALGGAAAGAALAAHLLFRRGTGAGRAVHEAPPEEGAALTWLLLAWVLDEGVALAGLVLGLLGFSGAIWGPFSAAGLVLMLLHRPPRRG